MISISVESLDAAGTGLITQFNSDSLALLTIKRVNSGKTGVEMSKVRTSFQADDQKCSRFFYTYFSGRVLLESIRSEKAVLK
jgi:hypothetical protein